MGTNVSWSYMTDGVLSSFISLLAGEGRGQGPEVSLLTYFPYWKVCFACGCRLHAERRRWKVHPFVRVSGTCRRCDPGQFRSGPPGPTASLQLPLPHPVHWDATCLSFALCWSCHSVLLATGPPPSTQVSGRGTVLTPQTTGGLRKVSPPHLLAEGVQGRAWKPAS